MYIGDIYLPILSNIDKKSVSKITKEIAGINITDPKTVSIRRNLQPITLEGYLYNDGEKTDEQYAEDVEALQYRSAGYCFTQYADLDGFIEIDNADAPETSEELGVRNYSVEGKYLPASKYERIVEVETEMRDNEFNIEFPPHVALPVGATNVRVKTSQDSVKLSTPTFMAGDIPIYRPFPAFYPDDVTHSDSDTPQYDATAYKLTYNLLDTEDESISYTMVSGIDIPLGSYRVVLRIKEDSVVTGDVKITVSDGTTNVVDSLHTLVGDGVWNIVKTVSFSILQKGLTYTITVTKAEADATSIAVNYGFLLPDKRARVAFDVAAEYDVGECKVYDTVTTDAAEAGWIQVYNPEHDFAGDIVVQNSMFRWVIKQTAWKDATTVYNVSGSAPVEIGELYNKAFGDDSVAIKFKEIKPNYLKFTFELDTGNATSESTSAKEIDTVEITPFNVVIDKDVIGAYKDHYTFESTPDEMIEYENGVIAGIDSNSVYGLIKSVDVTSSYDGDIIETTGSESSDSYVVPFVIPCEITSYLYKQAADLVISKDNNDIERKFWKDDFSVDSSDNYTGDVASFTWDTANQKLTNTTSGLMFEPTIRREGKYSLTMTLHEYVPGVNNLAQMVICSQDEATRIVVTIGTRTSGDIGVFLEQRIGGSSIYSDQYATPIVVDQKYLVEAVVSDSQIQVYIDGVLAITKATIAPEGMMGIRASALATFENLTFAPSESYSDDFATDTTERYQPVLGTVAYDDANKRMNVTTASGANGKASGRLRSYKFCEGSQIYDVLLPTGADGDFICMVTHATNGAMDNGIGVGLQSDGAGNWNPATLSNTTVTGGASSGLVDGKTARIEIEKDLSGAYWYYIYDASGTKPTTATGKLFTTLTEGYTGWYANGNSKTYAINNISIRAESIVGRTNVEVTEPFWFRDEATVNALGRYIRTGKTGAYSYNGTSMRYLLTTTGNESNNLTVPKTVKNPSVSVDLYPISSTERSYGGILLTSSVPGTTYTHISGSYARVEFDQSLEQINLRLYSNLTTISSTSLDIYVAFSYEDKFTLTMSDDGSTVTATLYNSAGEVLGSLSEDVAIPNCQYVSLTGYPLAATTSRKIEFDNLQISGTRVYNRPIHRGAMLESYHDGTQEVVGTTFIDDCQWDRSAEYVSATGWTHNAASGRYEGGYSLSRWTKHKYGDGIYKFRIHAIAKGTNPNVLSVFVPFYFQVQDTTSFINNTLFKGATYYLIINAGTSAVSTYYTPGTGSGQVLVGTFIFTASQLPVGSSAVYELDISNNIASLSIDGVAANNTVTLNQGLTSGYFGVCGGYYTTYGSYAFGVSDIQIIAASSDATNGIAACIPPIGGGARYGVEESVYNTFTTENVNKGSYIAAVNIKTTNIAADEASLEFINETDSDTLSLERTETEKSLTVTADYTVLTESLYIDDDETDTLTVGVKNSTTCDQSTIYVESLSLIPVSGDDVLYPQDLAFISGVKPSQKRKVEVK